MKMVQEVSQKLWLDGNYAYLALTNAGHSVAAQDQIWKTVFRTVRAGIEPAIRGPKLHYDEDSHSR